MGIELVGSCDCREVIGLTLPQIYLLYNEVNEFLSDDSRFIYNAFLQIIESKDSDKVCIGVNDVNVSSDDFCNSVFCDKGDDAIEKMVQSLRRELSDLADDMGVDMFITCFGVPKGDKGDYRRVYIFFAEAEFIKELERKRV